VGDADDGHAMMGIIDPVDHSIGAASGAVSILERGTEPLADALRVVEQRPDYELVRRKRDWLGQVFGQLPSSCGRDD
jgi:hypothetical protein